MKSNKLLHGIGILMVLSLALAACAPAVQPPQAGEAPLEDSPAEEPVAAESPAGEETAGSSQLIFAISSEPDTLMPGYGISAEAAYGFQLVFSRLTTKDLDGNVVGDLASAWEMSDDQLTWTFQLVEDATWHDGAPFTASDVAYTIEMLADPAYTGMDYTMIGSIAGAKEKHNGTAQSISGINIIDDHTISLTTSEPNALLLETMAEMMSILPAHLLADTPVAELPNSEFARKPVGTGPFKLREWNTEESLIFDRNVDYFQDPPAIDVFMWRIIPEASAQITGLLNGELDFMAVSADDFPQVETVEGISTRTTPGTLSYNINFHSTDPFLADARTRQAIAHAMDREEMLIGNFGGLGSVESCIFHPSLMEYDPTLTGYEYNPELAKSMLAEVGWKDEDGDGILEAHGVEGVADGTPFALEVVTRSIPSFVRYNEMIQQYLKAIGIDATINSVEVSVYFSDHFTAGGPWQVSGSRWINLIGAPQQELLWNITCDSNSMFDYCNQSLDDMIYANNTIFNAQERAANFHKILKIMEDEVIYIPMIRQLDLYAFDSNLVISDFQSVIDIYRSLPSWAWK